MMDINPDTSKESAAIAKPAAKSAKSSVAAGGAALQKAASSAQSSMEPRHFDMIPTMHKGGPVMKDGTYRLKMGEHVLTAKETAKAKQHALMSSGIKSLAKSAPKGK